MGIQINGQTDIISAVDGALTVSGAELPTVTNLNATGIVTATGFVGNVTGNINASGVSTIATLNVTGNINASGVSTIATLNVTQSNPINLNVSGVTTTATLRATSIVGVTTAGITTAYISAINDGPIAGTRNRIINGDMRIDQRNAGAAVTPNNSYTLDRWKGATSVSSKYTVQQSSTAPTGFKNSLLVTSSSAYSLTAGDYFAVGQSIEGFNIADLGWGAAGASSITISFWVRSSLTGSFGGSLRNSSYNRSYPFTYTISSANTFEYKTVTVAGDTTGTWSSDNSSGIEVLFGLGVGSTYSGTAGAWAGASYISATGATSVVGTSGATFYITGVQLEPGTVATPFERRSHGAELALCQRYCEIVAGVNGTHSLEGTYFPGSFGQSDVIWHFKQTKRATPTITLASGSSGYANGVTVDWYQHANTSAAYPRIAAGTTASAEL